MKLVQKNHKITQHRQNIYADLKRTQKEFQVGENFFVKVKPRKRSLKLASCAKLAPMYCGLFEILSRVGLVVY